MVRLINSHYTHTCKGCGKEIDLMVCWCGDLIESHSHFDHSPVPLGCECFKETNVFNLD